MDAVNSTLADRMRRLFLGAATAAFFICGTAASASEPSLEYTVKATYLYKFSDFIEWPASAFDSQAGEARLCVVGEDPFGNALDDAVHDQRIGDRPISVRRMETAAPGSGCLIMFIAGPNSGSVSQALETVRGEGVLTITDGARSADSAGIINFVITDNRVRFEIDDQAAATNGLVISSKLLGLATSVKRRG